MDLTGLLFRHDCKRGLLSGDSKERFAPFPKRHEKSFLFGVPSRPKD